MRNWHSLFEIFLYPIRILILGFFLLGVGNILTNPAFSSLFRVSGDFVVMAAGVCSRTGSFLVVNFPLFFMLRLVARKGGSAATVVSALAGYVTFLVVTMYAAPSTFPQSAYSSILGLSMSTVNPLTLSSSVHYPLQTGLVGALLTGFLTLWRYSRSRGHSEYSLFGFIDRDVWCVITTIFWCGISSRLLVEVWPYILQGLSICVSFIASDTANPVNLGLYGTLDRFLSTLNLGTLIRTPFWYGSSGGSWISMGGASIAGDVNIWTAQVEANSISGMTGRFITPYYVLNLFAVPGMLLAVGQIQTDRLERRRYRGLIVFMILISLFTGTLLPLEIGMLFLSPLLYLMHLGMTAILFGVLSAMRIYLGFQCSTNLTMTALPGTLLEYITYFQSSALRSSAMRLLVVGAIYFVIYYAMTQLYFRHLAIDIFHTGGQERLVNATIEAVGGVGNIKLVHSSFNRLVIGLYEPQKIDVNKLREAGAIRIVESKAGFSISFGAASTMIRTGIQTRQRQSIRDMDGDGQ